MQPEKMLVCSQHSIHTQGPKLLGNAWSHLSTPQIVSVFYVPGPGLDAGDYLEGDINQP